MFCILKDNNVLWNRMWNFSNDIATQFFFFLKNKKGCENPCQNTRWTHHENFFFWAEVPIRSIH